MYWFIFIIFILQMEGKRNKDSLIFDFKRGSLITVLLSVIMFSFFVNRSIMNDPRNHNIHSNLWLNYTVPFTLCFLGLCAKQLSRWVRILILALGFFGFSYLALHYLIGFHNPYWETLHLKPLHWLSFPR
jgi:uncharacterized protein YybS (DUF2232 family)